MISKYGNADILTYDFYKPLLKGGNSDKYLSHLKNLAEKYKADYDANRQRRVNLNKLDGPPIEISIGASKYRE